ncbi:hypothetical protein A2W24_01975 [Microgenomates group bacterium RBG_16_45_19]|nr:MAG: hypothetical protein A2W24_01975 [Microgenomates group bacterium RBG_16_45_19]
MPNANWRDQPRQVLKVMGQLPWDSLLPRWFDWVYLLGVFDYSGPLIVTHEGEVDLASQTERLPSLFAISNHQSVHPLLGTNEDLVTLIQAIHETSGKVMVDFVTNHTGTTHPWVKSYPEYYQKDNQGLKTAFSQDVYCLDYAIPQVSQAMIEVLRQLVSWGVDGVRCDMAHLVPLSFWEGAISKIKAQKPNFYFLAEVYSQSVFDWQPMTQMIAAGFDAVYDEFFFRNLKWHYQDHQSLALPLAHWQYILMQPQRSQLLHYLANHDDPLPQGSINYQEAWLSLMMLTGPSLIYLGQLNGLARRLAHHWLDLLPSEVNDWHQLPSWYLKLRSLIRTLDLSLETLNEENNGLIYGRLASRLGTGQLVLNLGLKDQLLTPERLEGTRMLRPKSLKLTPGQVEISI